MCDLGHQHDHVRFGFIVETPEIHVLIDMTKRLMQEIEDIHYVKTASATPSISIHLLANDTACVWRHKFDPEAGTVRPFRSGYSNAPCPPEDPTAS